MASFRRVPGSSERSFRQRLKALLHLTTQVRWTTPPRRTRPKGPRARTLAVATFLAALLVGFYPQGLVSDSQARLPGFLAGGVSTTSPTHTPPTSSAAEPPWTSPRGASSLEAGRWVNLSGGSASPPARSEFGFAYDPLHEGAVVFGGRDNSNLVLGDTWEFAAGNWTELTSSLSSAPSARTGDTLTYDPDLGAILLFGGQDGAGNWLNDTWEFNGSWTQISASVAPSPRVLPILEYEPAAGDVLLYSGWSHGVAHNDTWTFSSVGWTNISATAGPSPPRSRYGSTYDPADRAVLIYGGYRSSCFNTGLNVTWEFSAGRWSNLTGHLAISPPTNEGSTTIAYDAAEPGVVAFSGRIGPSCTVSNETWVFHAGVWVNLSSRISTAPPGEWEGRMVYDPTDSALILFGGNDEPQGGGNDFVNYTWEYVIPLSVQTVVSPTSGFAPLNVSLGATVVGGVLPYRYNWSFDDGSANLTTANGAHTFASSGMHRVELEVQDAWNTTNITTAIDNVRAILPLTLSAGPSTVAGVVPFLVGFRANASGGNPPITFDWSFGDGATAAGPTVNHTYLAKGVFTANLSVVDLVGLRSTRSWSIQAVLPLRATITTVSFEGLQFFNDTFAVGPTDGLSPFTYVWDFGDGSPSMSTPVVNHSFSQPGTYTVRVSVTDALGEAQTANLTVSVAKLLAVTAAFPSVTVPYDAVANITRNVSGGLPPIALSWQGLPRGCTGGDAAAIECIPRDAGEFPITLTATDRAGEQASGHVALIVESPPNAGSGNDVLIVVLALGAVGAVGATAYVVIRRRGPPGTDLDDAPQAELRPTESEDPSSAS